jgi:hypothetical protein
VLARTVRIALVVGTLLSVVNQGAVVAAGDATASIWIRVVVNYALPFCVSTITYLSALRAS